MPPQPKAASARNRVLAAAMPATHEFLRHALESDFELVLVTRLEDALAELADEARVDLIVCGVHFDESRMFELLRYARAHHAQIPFLCCRMLDAELPRVSREALQLGAETLGALYIDLAVLAREAGPQFARRALRAEALSQLEPDRQSQA